MSDTGNRAIEDGFSPTPGVGRFASPGAPGDSATRSLAGGAVWHCFVEVDRPDQPTNGFGHAQPAH